MFRSFFMAGFECSTGWNRHGNWFDQVVATEHDLRLLEDYRLVRQAGMRVVREGIRWPLVDKANGYDFQSVDPAIHAARTYGLDVIWDLFHYGYPQDLDPFSDRFVQRFAGYCRAVAERILERSEGPFYFTPVNEPSYFAWAAGDAGLFAPHAMGRSFELKVNLIRAAIAGIDAIRSVIPEARFVNADPICRVVAPRDQPDREDEATWFNENAVFQSFDMLSGRMMPELGGSPDHLDIIGLNYYWTNQWEHGLPDQTIHPHDDRHWALVDLLRWVHHRYPGHEMIVSETSHHGENRPAWLAEVVNQVELSLEERIPLRGVCLYPVLGMPEWHEPSVWAPMGLWDSEMTDEGCIRVPHLKSLAVLAQGQSRLEGLTFMAGRVPRLLTGEHHLY